MSILSHEKPAEVALLPEESSIDYLPELPEYVIDRHRKRVDLKGDVWRLNDPAKSLAINWKLMPVRNPLVIRAWQFYLSVMIQSKSPSHVCGMFGDFRAIRSVYSGELDRLKGEELEARLPELLYRFLADLRRRGRGYVFYRVRAWYIWCADMSLPGFSQDIAGELDELVLKGNEKGEAVRSHDPLKGALQPVELEVLRNALRRHEDDKSMLEGIVHIWLHIALGCNPRNIALMREEDFLVKSNPADKTAKIYLLNVPRIKKLDTVPRLEFKQRKLNPELGRLVESLISYNQERYPELEPGCERPLFVSRQLRTSINPDNMAYGRHMTSKSLCDLMKVTVARMGVVSPITGRPLSINPRRLRRTFGTIAASQGMPMRVLADLMDHTDLQHVQIYYQVCSSFVKKLNATYAEKLAPMVDLFMGKITAIDPDEVPQDRIIYGLPSMRKITSIGYCGSSDSCDFMPPRSCYVCPKFRPFRDADHRGCLTAMVEERQLRFKGDIGIDAQLDSAIIACAEVCRRVEEEGGEEKEGEEKDGEESEKGSGESR